MNKEQQGLLDEAYENYENEINRRFSIPIFEITDGDSISEGDIHESTSLDDVSRIWMKEEFINKCKTDSEFSEKWGLKIKERELSLEERVDYKKKRDGIARTFATYTHQMLDGSNIPTKLITITYNNETVESHENNS